MLFRSRLQKAGPLILQTLIRGDMPLTPSATAPKPLTTKETAVMYVRAILGSLFLFPQGIVPIIFKLTGNHETRVWFLAMYMPGIWGWVTAIVMATIGVWLWYKVIFKSKSAPHKNARST